MVQKIFTEQLTGTTLTLESANGTPVVLSAANTGSLVSGGVEVGAGGGSTTYADMAELVAETGMSDGDMAFVLASNNLYIYKTNGWFKIATVENLQPGSISGVDASYELADDGTPTVITATATDPEGFPLTWSYAVTTGSLANTATVSQVNNVFTVTPSANTANGGDFSITFSVTDGVNGAVNAVSAFTLAFAWTADVSNFSYDSVSFSVASQASSCGTIRFNTDGTKAYTCDINNGTIYQYSLTTGFDISTASYDSVSFDASTQEANTTSFFFNNDGTKMYVTGFGDVVYQYSLSTAFNVGTATYDSVSFTSNETLPRSLFFSADGTKMYVLGQGNDTVYEYTLSTGFDLSTASYNSVSLSVSAQDTLPTGVFFNPDGTKMYICGQTSDSIHQYTLSTGFDLSTASYDNSSFNINTAGSSNYSTGLAFNADGTKAYITDSSLDSFLQYSTGL